MHSLFLASLLPALVAASHLQHAPRQTEAPDAASCLAALTSIGNPPPIPEEFASMTAVEPMADPCNYTPPATLASAYSSYSTAAMEWMSQHGAEVTSVLEQCPDLASQVNALASAAMLCTAQGATPAEPTEGAAEPTPTESVDEPETPAEDGADTPTQTQGTGNGTAAAGATSATSSAAGVKETSFVAGVVAVVGVVGAFGL